MRSCFPLAAALCLTAGAAAAQTAVIALSSGAVRFSDRTAALDLSMQSSGAPAASLQWSFEYDASSGVDIVVEDGPAAIAVQKNVVCAPNPGGCTCLALGLNATIIPDGIIAKVTVALAPARAATILVTNALAASADGAAIPLATSNETVTVTAKPPFIPGRPRAPRRGPTGK